MDTVIGIIIGFLILMLLVVAHEFGHFIAARRNGVEVEEFGIGFPPRIKAWKLKSGMTFSLNWLPIGGFCSMKGESDSDERKGSFGAASLWSKTKILFAGVAMNWLAAFIILTILAATGMPEFMDNQFTLTGSVKRIDDVVISKVIPDSAAEKAGLKTDDAITKACVKDQEKESCVDITSPTDLIDYNSAHAGETVYYTIYSTESLDDLQDLFEEAAKNDKDAAAKINTRTAEVKLGSKDDEFILGAYLYKYSPTVYEPTPFYAAPLVGAINTVQLTGETYRGLGSMVGSFFSGIFKQFSTDENVKQEGREQIGQAGDSVSGPVGIIGVLFPASVQSGPRTLAFLAAIISISLACMNVLPIPALDGGRFVLIAFFRLRGKKLKKEVEEKIVSRTFVFLLILIALVTILDITRFF